MDPVLTQKEFSYCVVLHLYNSKFVYEITDLIPFTDFVFFMYHLNFRFCVVDYKNSFLTKCLYILPLNDVCCIICFVSF